MHNGGKGIMIKGQPQIKLYFFSLSMTNCTSGKYIVFYKVFEKRIACFTAQMAFKSEKQSFLLTKNFKKAATKKNLKHLQCI